MGIYSRGKIALTGSACRGLDKKIQLNSHASTDRGPEYILYMRAVCVLLTVGLDHALKESGM
jgi:hypothetical protein